MLPWRPCAISVALRAPNRPLCGLLPGVPVVPALALVPLPPLIVRAVVVPLLTALVRAVVVTLLTALVVPAVPLVSPVVATPLAVLPLIHFLDVHHVLQRNPLTVFSEEHGLESLRDVLHDDRRLVLALDVRLPSLHHREARAARLGARQGPLVEPVEGCHRGLGDRRVAEVDECIAHAAPCAEVHWQVEEVILALEALLVDVAQQGVGCDLAGQLADHDGSLMQPLALRQRAAFGLADCFRFVFLVAPCRCRGLRATLASKLHRAAAGRPAPANRLSTKQVASK
mmetsp:Transcript_57627/g.151664  ORF Transcript_57627/g.151664 Transcript_57627/m.151664 type:complete len:285 (-) Transcript_57627:110-964(-)